MKQITKSILPLAMAATGLLGTTWSTASHACAFEPLISSVCIMATGRAFEGFSLANGATLTLNQNQALFALIGVTYGGDGKTNFKIPDLQGRVVIGAGKSAVSGKVYNVGDKGGAETITLTTAQLPAHNHTLSPPVTGRPTGVTSTATLGNMTVSLSGLTASTSLAGGTANVTIPALDGSAKLDAITHAGTVNDLEFKASNVTGTITNGTPVLGYALGNGGATKIYTNVTTPNVSLNGVTASGVTFPSGTTSPVTTTPKTASASLSGTVAGTVTGNATLGGAPAVTVSGSTDATGSSMAVTIMPPYLAMNYYIATSGIFPTLQ